MGPRPFHVTGASQFLRPALDVGGVLSFLSNNDTSSAYPISARLLTVVGLCTPSILKRSKRPDDTNGPKDRSDGRLTLAMM